MVEEEKIDERRDEILATGISEEMKKKENSSCRALEINEE